MFISTNIIGQVNREYILEVKYNNDIFAIYELPFTAFISASGTCIFNDITRVPLPT